MMRETIIRMTRKIKEGKRPLAPLPDVPRQRFFPSPCIRRELLADQIDAWSPDQSHNCRYGRRFDVPLGDVECRRVR